MNNNMLSYNGIADKNPSHILIEATSYCNLKCIMCLHHYENFGKNLDKELFNQVFTELSSDLKKVEFSGIGEPIINPLVTEFINQYYDKEIEISLTSNGTLLNNDELAKKIVRSNFLLNISIDGADKQTYEYYRYSESAKWEDFIAGLECLKRNAEEAGNEKRFFLNFLIVGMKKNIVQLEEFVKLAHKYGVRAIFVRVLTGMDIYYKIKDQALTDIPEIVAENYYKALDLAKKLNVSLGLDCGLKELIKDYPNPSETNIKKETLAVKKDNHTETMEIKKQGAKIGGKTCQWPFNNSFFSLDGDILPCCYTSSEVLGNIKNNSWEEIWNGSLYKNIRKNLYSWNPNDICRRCCYELAITGGNMTLYDDYFNNFRKETLKRNAEEVNFVEGFSVIEHGSHIQKKYTWLNKKGKIILPMKKNAKFLAINIFKRTSTTETNPGICVINNGTPEPFDNSNNALYFPLNHIKKKTLEVCLEMENVYTTDSNNIPFSLGIHSFAYLFEDAIVKQDSNLFRSMGKAIQKWFLCLLHFGN